MKNIKTIRFSVRMLTVMAVALFLAYALLAANALRAQYSIEDLENKVLAVQKEADELNINLSEASSLDNILEQSGTLSYTEIQNVSYIEKPSDSPLASR